MQGLVTRLTLCASGVFALGLTPGGPPIQAPALAHWVAQISPCVTLTLPEPPLVTPTLVAPTIVAPTLVAPTVVAPTLVTPTLVAPTLVAPTLVTPNLVAPAIVSTCDAPNAQATPSPAPQMID